MIIIRMPLLHINFNLAMINFHEQAGFNFALDRLFLINNEITPTFH